MSEMKTTAHRWLLAGTGLLVLATSFGVSGCGKNSKASAAPPVSVEVLERTPKGAADKKAKSPAKPAVVVGSPEDLARRYQIPVTVSQPTQGPADALVTITTWCDFRSEQCRSADKVMKTVMAKNKDARWAFRHFPASKAEYGPHVFAQAAMYRSKKFWEVRDKLLQLPTELAPTEDDLRKVARELGIEQEMFGPDFSKMVAYLEADARFAEMFGVEKPMGIFVNGRRVPSAAGEELSKALDTLIREERDHARKLVKSGVKPAELYYTLIKDAYWGVFDSDELRAKRAEKEAEKKKEEAGLATADSKVAETSKAKTVKSAKSAQ